MAAQAEKASKVISQLFAKPLKKDGDENASKDNKRNDSEFTTLARFAIAVEKKEKSALHRAQVNGSGPSKETEESVPPKIPCVNPDVDIKKTWNLTSTEELHRLDSLNDTHTNENSLSSEREVSTRGNGVTGNLNSPKSICEESSNSSVSTVVNGDSGFRETSIDEELWKKQKDQTSSRESTHKNTIKNSNKLELSKTVQKNGGELGNGKCKENGLDANGNNARSSLQKPVHQTNGGLNQNTNKVSEKQSKPTEPEDIRNIKNENETEGSASTSSSSDSNKASEKNESSTSCSAGLSQRWNRAATERQVQKDHKKEAKKTQIEKALGDNLESVMLDAVGLEIKQWENMINKPKHWHYCWQILRKDMIPVHHCNT